MREIPFTLVFTCLFPRYVKIVETSQSVSCWLSFIFQQSYDCNTVPSDWSNALVTAIFKKGNKSDPANYRPISLTCICCKIMEHIILSHMSKHLSLNNILIDQQHGFREKFSCETQLISAVHDWAKGINLCQQTDVILLDFSKAFDSVPHERLLTKLDYYGIRGKMLNWIKAFLSNRTQKVSVNGVLSSSRPVVSGVPQGSVLGPVLFILFINDISCSVQSNLRLFADDCVLYREVATSQDCLILQQDLHRLFLWSKTWQLTFNVNKCYHLGITCKRTPVNFNYTLDGKLISRVASATYLGISISDNLSWNKHCDIICKKANSTLGLLRRILSGCTPEVKSTAYLTLVRPKLEYASCVWNPHTQCNINKIEMVQRRAARFVHNDYSRFTHVTLLIKALRWDSLEHRRLTNQVFMFYKIYTGLVGISLPPEVVCNTRASRLPNCAPFCQLATLNDTYKYSFYPRAIRTWNSLPLALIPNSLDEFKVTISSM